MNNQPARAQPNNVVPNNKAGVIVKGDRVRAYQMPHTLAPATRALATLFRVSIIKPLILLLQLPRKIPANCCAHVFRVRNDPYPW